MNSIRFILAGTFVLLTYTLANAHPMGGKFGKHFGGPYNGTNGTWPIDRPFHNMSFPFLPNGTFFPPHRNWTNETWPFGKWFFGKGEHNGTFNGTFNPDHHNGTFFPEHPRKDGRGGRGGKMGGRHSPPTLPPTEDATTVAPGAIQEETQPPQDQPTQQPPQDRPTGGKPPKGQPPQGQPPQGQPPQGQPPRGQERPGQQKPQKGGRSKRHDHGQAGERATRDPNVTRDPNFTDDSHDADVTRDPSFTKDPDYTRDPSANRPQKPASKGRGQNGGKH